MAVTAACAPLLGRYSRAAPAAARRASQPQTFDLHCHPGAFFGRGTASYPGDEAFAKTVSEMQAGGLSAAFFSIVADRMLLTITDKGIVVTDHKPAEGEVWADCLKQLSALDELARHEPIGLATSVHQAQAIAGRGQVAAFIACEGGDGLEGRVERLDDLYRHGVRSLQLTHYAQNDLGDLQTLPAVYNGLSPFGRDVVRRMNRLGMVVDVAHASFATAKATVDITSAPIMLSHTHLQSEASPHPRLITAEHARLISSTGGVIGAWPSGFANHTLADFIDQTMRLIDVVGVDHVGLGTDMDGNYKPVLSSYLQLPDWINGLRGKGLAEVDVAKVAGGNALRVVGKVLSS